MKAGGIGVSRLGNTRCACWGVMALSCLTVSERKFAFVVLRGVNAIKTE